jgi:hypothetical protein
MKKYTNSELFVLLNNSEEHSQKEYENSYIDFIQELLSLNSQVPDIIYRHNILTYLHIELVAIRMKANISDSKKHTEKGICLFKAISIVGSHRKIVESLITKDEILSKQKSYIINQDLPKLVWTSTIRDLVELIYALYYSKSLNNGEMTLKEIVQHFEQFFGVKIGKFSHSFLRIRERMKERTVFVSKLQNTLESKMKEKDH